VRSAKEDKEKSTMTTRDQERSSPLADIGESRTGDLAVTVLSALILLVVLAIVATL